MSSSRSQVPQGTPPPPGSTAPTWFLLFLVLAAIGGIGYFAFYDTGREADAGKPPAVISLTSPSPVSVATPTPTPSPSETP
ncbi:MAG: hypothetical protein H8F28_27860 [Fibrella sp.]|nr:hypothetical protein [Armatimonadota bacterium]